MNRPKLRTLVSAAAALLGGVITANVVPVSRPSPAGDTEPVGGNRGNAGGAIPPTESALARVVRTEKGSKRWLTVLAQADNATAEQMPALIRSVGNDSAMLRMLAARWAELDPKHMFASLYADYLQPDDAPGTLPGRWVLTNVLFEEWVKIDSPAVVKALNEVPNFKGRDNLRMTVSSQLFKADVELGLTAMKEWNIRHYVPDMNKVSEWAARDPRHAAEVVAGLGAEYAAREAMKHVGRAWAQSDPEGGLRYASTLNGGTRASLASEIIGTWAQRDLKAAVKFASSEGDPLLRAAVAPGLVNAWAKTDASGALDWSQEHLRGAVRTEAIGGIIKTVSEKSIEAAGELVAGMEPGAAQNRACASIFETWFNKGKDQREAAFAWLAELPDPAARQAAFDKVQWNWAWNDPNGVREFITGPYGDLAPPMLVNQVARNQTAKNPEAAMEWASALPAKRVNDARRAVLENWLQLRPDGAAAYALKLPTGKEREQAIALISQRMIFQSPDASLAWFEKLPAEDRANVRKLLEHTHLDPQRRGKLDEILNAK